MNKRYIDFVPAKKGAGAAKPAVKPAVKSSVAKPAVAKPAVKMPEPTEFIEKKTEVDEIELDEIFAEREKPAGVSEGLKYGVIEDLKPHFVKTEVNKRPLNSVNKEKDIEARKAELEAAKAKKIATRASFVLHRRMKTDVGPKSDGVGSGTRLKTEVTSEKVDKILDEALTEAENVTKQTRRPVRNTPFVNTEGVEKRPLSKNVYTKRVVVPKEEPSGPVTIIQKPERDSRVGLIVAIIITIILGATAGTVAFLLLPK